MRRPARRGAGAAWVACLTLFGVHTLALAAPAGADWLQPDVTYREAQFELRMAARDTAGHSHDPARLDSLGLALLRLAHLGEAEKIFRRSLRLARHDDAAEAGLGKLALFSDRLAEAESLLEGAAQSDAGALRDLFAARIRRGEYAAAAAMAADLNEEGRVPLLQAMAERPIYQVGGDRSEATVLWARSYPVPLIRVKLNGQSVLMALDTGASDVLIDESAARRCGVEPLPAQRLEFWTGSRVAVKNAMVQRLEIGGVRVERIPAGTLSLRKWSIEVNPQSEPVAGIIGLNLLRCFTSTLDYKNSRLELRRRDGSYKPAADAQRVPFEVWGQSELTVYGSLAGSRKMALVVQSGVPGCGVGAPSEVLEEIGVKPGAVARMVKGAGAWLQGRPWSQVMIPAVSVGAVVKDKVPGWSGAFDSSELWRHGVRRDGLLSHDFFRGRRVTIDWQAHELVFEE